MRYLNGCTECFTVWWGCRCPLKCGECGAGYRDDGNSNCNTPGCRAGEQRRWEMQARWKAVEVACFEEAERQGEACRAAGESPLGAPSVSEPTEALTGPEATSPPAKAAPEPRAAPRGRAGVQNGQPRKPDARSAARPSARHDEPQHRPVAERRAEVIALLGDGLSDREIARRVKVSPSTVSAIKKAQAGASHA